MTTAAHVCVAHATIDATAIADAARTSLLEELHTWPKPGLVSHVDCGAHDDMDASTFVRSVEAITPYFEELARAGCDGEQLQQLRKIGCQAEQAMLHATGGINTHRGAIFSLGLLCAAAGRRTGGLEKPIDALGRVVVSTWGAALGSHSATQSHGETVHRLYGAGGARQEAACGFPSAYRVGLPALAAGERLARGHAEAARVHAIFALISALEDTNLLYRAGPSGLSYARLEASAFLGRGSVGRFDWRSDAAALHARFTARRLSPGGAADLLAVSLFLRRLERPNTWAGPDRQGD